MTAIDRYVFRTTLSTFLVVLVSLTAIIWVTQALRDFDLMTVQGQTLLTFIGITGLLMPMLILVIAPVALVIAVAFVLNRMSSDSELIIMNASGMSPWRLFRAFLIVAVLVSVMVAFIAAYLAPKGLRELRDWLTAVRTDLVTSIIKPGRFITIEKGLTFHIRERQLNGKLIGVLLDDRRDPQQHVTVVAQQGEIVKNDHGTFLLLQHGSVQRHVAGQADPTIVVFDRYAFDLSRFDAKPEDVKYSVRERYLWQLIDPSANDRLATTEAAKFRAELNDRLMAPLYPLCFVLVTYAFLGAPRTTRQSRGLSLISAIAIVFAVRFIGYASMMIGQHFPPALAAQYVALIAATAFGAHAISRGLIIEPPTRFVELMTAIGERLSHRRSPTVVPS